MGYKVRDSVLEVAVRDGLVFEFVGNKLFTRLTSEFGPGVSLIK